MSSNPNQPEAMDESHSQENFYLHPRPSTSSQELHTEPQSVASTLHIQNISNNPMQNIYNSRYYMPDAFGGPSTSFNPHLVVNEPNFDGHSVASQSSVEHVDENKPRAVIRPTYYQDYNAAVSDITKQAANKINIDEKPKRIRTVFTQEHKDRLEEEYKLNKYIDQRRRLIIANSLNLTEKTVKVWFQNQRMKDKKEKEKNDQGQYFRCLSISSDDDEGVESLSPDSSPIILDDGYQTPTIYQSSMLNHHRAHGLLRNRYLSCSSSTGYSSCLQPLEEVSDFDSGASYSTPSPVANVTSLTVNLIPNPTEREHNVTVVKSPSSPDKEETEASNFNSFSISRFMNLDE